MAQRRWSQNMRQAWSYANSTYAWSMSATQGLKQYRSGGGKIRDSDWFYLRRLSVDTAKTTEQLSFAPTGNVVPKSAHTAIGWDYRNDYVATGIIRGIDPETGSAVTVHVTVESDNPLTLEQWSESLLDQVALESGSKPLKTPTLKRVNFYQPTRQW